MIEKFRKMGHSSGRERSDLEQEMARLKAELEEYKRLHILSENSHLKIEKQVIEMRGVDVNRISRI